jgi:hypothetical protein
LSFWRENKWQLGRERGGKRGGKWVGWGWEGREASLGRIRDHGAMSTEKLYASTNLQEFQKIVDPIRKEGAESARKKKRENYGLDGRKNKEMGEKTRIVTPEVETDRKKEPRNAKLVSTA